MAAEPINMVPKNLDKAEEELSGASSAPDDVRVQKVVFGICAMAKKTGGKPMREILRRLEQRHANEFEIIVFDESIILNEPIHKWPLCDALMAWFSTGFPLDKAIEYAELRKPYLVNDLAAQKLLMDRRQVFRRCAEFEIPLPRHAFVNRDDCQWKNGLEDLQAPSELKEEEDCVVINGVVFNKPFVEKPISGEDHNIYIYYPRSAGGGIKKLFRKTGDKSSEYCKNEWAIRRDGSFIYEDFLPTEGVDVKVYAVGAEYAHAEARKAPTLDGKVQRDNGGNEVRYPVVLSVEEKVIGSKLVSAFGQTICGFDVLRSIDGNFVCDVNGFSFVKKNKKYYDDTVFILRSVILTALVPGFRLMRSRQSAFGLAGYDDSDSDACVTYDTHGSEFDDLPCAKGAKGEHDDEEAEAHSYANSDPRRFELRCVIGVVRHGDRTPKQKMKLKLKMKDPVGAALLSLFEAFGKPGSKKELKLKKGEELQLLLDTTTALLADAEGIKADQRSKLRQLEAVLARWEFSGINRKAQMKPTEWQEEEEGKRVVTAGILVMKWGGELTNAGKEQAESLGRWARESLYMGESAGLLRLHASYRHDLKIYSSDEGRVQMTAAAFAKGFLDLEGELTPILVGLVRRDGINALLDETQSAERDLTSTKSTLYPLINSNTEASETLSTNSDKPIGTFRNLLDRIVSEVNLMVGDIKEMQQLHTENAPTFYHFETLDLLCARWQKLLEDFYDTENDEYDISKLPDLYDAIKYDAMHNVAQLKSERIWSLYNVTSSLAAYVCAQEYGMSSIDKCSIGSKICCSLVRKLAWDMQTSAGLIETDAGSQSTTKSHRTLHKLSTECRTAISNLRNPERNIRSRFYFTSESHVVSLINTLRFGDLPGGMAPCISDQGEQGLQQCLEYNYLTAITIRLFEDTAIDGPIPKDDPSRFFVEICLSPGVNIQPPDPSAETDENNLWRRHPPFQISSDRMPLLDFIEFLQVKVPDVGTPTDIMTAMQLMSASPVPTTMLHP